MNEKNEKNELDALLDSALQSYAPNDAPVGLERRVLAAVSAERKRPVLRWWVPVPVLSLAAVLLVGWLMMRPAVRPVSAPQVVAESAVPKDVERPVTVTKPPHRESVSLAVHERHRVVFDRDREEARLLVRMAAEHPEELAAMAQKAQEAEQPIAVASITVAPIAVKQLAAVSEGEEGGKTTSSSKSSADLEPIK